MNTTLIFAELLIIGLQTGLWLFFIVANLFGYEWLGKIDLAALANWETTILIIGVSILYMLGIAADRIADLFFAKWEIKIKDKFIPDSPLPPLTVMRFEVSKGNEYLNKHFEYTRSRMRIARASSLNFLLSTILAATSIVFRLDVITYPEKWNLLFVVVIVGFVITVISIYAWHNLTSSYFVYIRNNFRFYMDKENQKPKRSSKQGGKPTLESKAER